MYIDWSKIKRYIKGQVTSQEKVDVEMWIKRSEKNRLFIDNVKYFYSDCFYFFKDEKLEIEKAWQKQKKRTINKIKKKNILSKTVIWSMSLSAAIIAIHFGVNNITKIDSSDNNVVTELNIKLNNSIINSPELTLEDGSVVAISADSTKDQLVADFRIKGNKLHKVSDASVVKSDTIAYTTIRIPKGMTYELILSDSSRVMLNANSSLSFPSTFTDKERRVKLIGEAYFSVARNDNSPFLVEVCDGTVVRVLGTQFNIKSNNNASSETTLVSGSVQLNMANKKIQLLPGEKCVVDTSSREYDITYPDMSVVLAWTRGEFEFKDERLDSIVAQFSNWYGVDIVIDDEFVKRKRFHIYAKKNTPILDILSNLRKTEQISFDLRDNQISIRNFDK